jgi:hypothetical protein
LPAGMMPLLMLQQRCSSAARREHSAPLASALMARAFAVRVRSRRSAPTISRRHRKMTVRAAAALLLTLRHGGRRSRPRRLRPVAVAVIFLATPGTDLRAPPRRKAMAMASVPGVHTV